MSLRLPSPRPATSPWSSPIPWPELAGQTAASSCTAPVAPFRPHRTAPAITTGVPRGSNSTTSSPPSSALLWAMRATGPGFDLIYGRLSRPRSSEPGDPSAGPSVCFTGPGGRSLAFAGPAGPSLPLDLFAVDGRRGVHPVPRRLPVLLAQMPRPVSLRLEAEDGRIANSIPPRGAPRTTARRKFSRSPGAWSELDDEHSRCKLEGGATLP